MKVIFSGTGVGGSIYCNIHVNAGVGFALGLEKPKDRPGEIFGGFDFRCGGEVHGFSFKGGAYDYAGWLEAVCQMAIDAEQIHVTDVDGDVLCISTVGADGRHEARLKKTGECYVGNDVYDGSEK